LPATLPGTTPDALTVVGANSSFATLAFLVVCRVLIKDFFWIDMAEFPPLEFFEFRLPRLMPNILHLQFQTFPHLALILPSSEINHLARALFQTSQLPSVIFQTPVKN
jgi:hypothetical protein